METPNTGIVAMLPEQSRTLVSANGRNLGTRYFVGNKSAKDIKEVGKSLGYKGSGLAKYVREALTSEQANRAVAVAATVAALNEKGFIADTVTVKDKSAQIAFVRVGDGSRKATGGKLAAALAQNAQMAKELAELRAIINAK